MKPGQILFFVLSVLVVLLVISAIYPAGGIRINDELSLKFITLDEILYEDSLEYADITGIIDNSGIEQEVPAEDTVVQPAIVEVYDTIRANADSLRKITHLIEFSGEGKNLLHSFFHRIRSLPDQKELLRILHYGDSQIETDRITSYVRYRLQKTFGGSGPGMIPAVPVFNGSMSISQDYSENWERYTAYGKKDTTILHHRYGPLFSFSAYEDPLGDEKTDGWLEYRSSPIAFSTSRNFREIRLMTSKTRGALEVEIRDGDSLIHANSLPEKEGSSLLYTRLDETPGNLRFLFSGEARPQVYFVALDNDWGIAMDNIPLRGSAGLEFSKCDTSFLKQNWELLNTGLIILQFGGNVVPYMTNYQRYERFFRRELRVIRRLMPGVPVLVIGPSDMSVRDGGKYKTNPNLIKSRNALRKASLEAGYAFWDMFEAMGGENSMPSWVFADPPLAVSDFVHFNARGARIIGEMLFNALIYEYKLWEKAQGPIVAGAGNSYSE